MGRDAHFTGERHPPEPGHTVAARGALVAAGRARAQPRCLLPALPGSSPGGSGAIQRGDGISVLGKNLFNYRYIERLETDSVVGNTSGEKEAE